jgi:CRP-like cAMP-binding protein
MRQGGDCGVVLVLLRGRVKITLSEPDGFEQPIAVRHRGEVLGEIAALDLRPHTATVTAIDLCYVRVVPAARFKRFVAAHRLESVIARHHRAWLQEAERHRAELAAFPVDQRLGLTLLRLAREDERGRIVVDVRMSQEELGRMIGASRNAVGLVLGRLRELGIVTTHQLTVRIENVDALLGFAKGGAARPRPGRAAQ